MYFFSFLITVIKTNRRYIYVNIYMYNHDESSHTHLLPVVFWYVTPQKFRGIYTHTTTQKPNCFPYDYFMQVRNENVLLHRPVAHAREQHIYFVHSNTTRYTLHTVIIPTASAIILRSHIYIFLFDTWPRLNNWTDWTQRTHDARPNDDKNDSSVSTHTRNSRVCICYTVSVYCALSEWRRKNNLFS